MDLRSIPRLRPPIIVAAARETPGITATDWQIPIQLKLGAARVYDDVRMAVKCDPDSIYIDGMEGGTGAGPHLATEDTGVPGMASVS